MPQSADSIIIETINLTREVSDNGRAKSVVNDVSYRFEKGKIYNIVGPSGGGKTSLLRLLNRLDDPTGGEVRYRSQPLDSYQPTRLREKIAMLFQTPYLFPGTVEDNIKYTCATETDLDIEFCLRQVGLINIPADREVENISVGEKQRVAIARSLVMHPEVMLFDEPTAALDPTSSRIIEELIISLTIELKLTAIVVTHNPNQAKRLGGEALLLVGGRLIESGDTTQLLSSPESELGKKYINKELF